MGAPVEASRAPFARIRGWVRRRAPVSWAVLVVSLVCQVSVATLGALPAAATVLLGGSLVLTMGMFAVRTKRRFRLLLVPRLVILGLLVGWTHAEAGADLLLTLPLLIEICLTEVFPVNLAVSCAAILAAQAGRLLVLSGGRYPAVLAGRGAWDAGWIAVSFLFASLASMLLYYRERVITLERESQRLDGAVAELSRANLGYQEYAALLEQRSMMEERKRITREIHDIIGYTLTNNIMMMEAAVEAVRRDPDHVSRLITQARRNAEEGLDGIRNALYLLRAQEDPRLDGVDLIARLVGNFRAATGVDVRLEYGNTGEALRGGAEGVLVPIIQEALTNSFRHGRATLVEILFWRRDDGTLVVTIGDNGRGETAVHQGIGTEGMRERLEPLGGTLRLAPHAHGFTVTVELPPRSGDTA